MLKLLLDEHISRRVAAAFARENKFVEIVTLATFPKRSLLGHSDSIILDHATEHRFTLVTYDIKTIPPLLTQWALSARNHAGVIFVDERTIAPDDFGALSRALLKLCAATATQDWTNRVVFLRR